MVDRIVAEEMKASVENGASKIQAGFASSGFFLGEGQDDLVVFFFEFQNKMHAFDFIDDTEFNGAGRAEKIHRVDGVGSPFFNVTEIESVLLALN